MPGTAKDKIEKRVALERRWPRKCPPAPFLTLAIWSNGQSTIFQAGEKDNKIWLVNFQVIFLFCVVRLK
jgi:hypothetical protein